VLFVSFVVKNHEGAPWNGALPSRRESGVLGAMPDPSPEDITRVRIALQEGNKILAIKIYREVTGLGLAEAKDAIENFERNPETAQFARSAPAAMGPVPPGVHEALMAGNKIEAIKRYREATGVGLKEAKDAVDQIVRHQPGLPASVQVKSGCLGLLVVCAAPVGVVALWIW